MYIMKNGANGKLLCPAVSTADGSAGRQIVATDTDQLLASVSFPKSPT